MAGQTPELIIQRASLAKGRAKTLLSLRNTRAGMPSGPVALSSSNLAKNLPAFLVRMGVKLSRHTSANTRFEY